MDRRTVLMSGLAVATLSLAACGGSRDTPAAPSLRIVSAGGDVTEILFGLGLGDQIVAVDDNSLFPEPVTALPKIGYLRALGAEGVLSLAPTAVVASGDAGPPTTLAQLGDAGVRIVRTKTARTPDDVIANIAVIAAAFGRETVARALTEAFQREMAATAARVDAYPRKPRVLFLLAVNAGSPNAAGAGTAADAMIALAGGENAVSAYEGYKALSLEAVVATRPDVVLMMSHALTAAGGAERVAANPAIAATPAGRETRIVSIDGAFHLGFGPRLPAAVASLAELMRA